MFGLVMIGYGMEEESKWIFLFEFYKLGWSSLKNNE